MGAETHFNYSAVGDAVNVAARIESSCKTVGFDILVSDTTARSISDCAVLEAGRLPLKGKSTRTKVFAVVGDQHLAASPEFIDLQSAHKQAVHALRVRSPASRRLVKIGKIEGGTSFRPTLPSSIA